MALIVCEDCGNQISDKAHHCVHCGAPIILDEPTSQGISSRFQSRKPEVSGVNSHSSKLSDVERQEGVITKIKTSQKNAGSVTEILIQMPNGTIISTGEKDSKEIKPYFWTVDDLVSYREIDGKAADLKKVKNIELQSTYLPRSPSSKANNPMTPVGDAGDQRVTRNYVWMLFLIVLAFGYWIAKGTPSPGLIFAGSQAKSECVRLASENKGNMMILDDVDVIANDTWLKDGKRVVQMTQTQDGQIRTIMCLYGNGMVSIPSLMEQSRWR